MNNSDINKYARKQVEQIQLKCERIRPILVVTTLTYNHGKYIRDALEGFVNQKTNYKFVVIIHDDASTDSTPDIIHKYAIKYPDIILPIYEKENLYSKRNGEIGRIIKLLRETSDAKYCAICEGDDYWTDPYKLQKQVDFLEAHPDYSMVFSNAMNHWQNGEQEDDLFSNVEDRDYQGYEFVDEWMVPTASVVYRNGCGSDRRSQKLASTRRLVATDILRFLTCASNGKVRGMSDCMTVYRRLSTGAVAQRIVSQPYNFLMHEIIMGNGFGGKIKSSYQNKVGVRFTEMLSKGKNGEGWNWKYLGRAFWFAPISSIREVMKSLLKLRK